MMPQGCALYTLYNHKGKLKSILSDQRWARLKNSPTYTDDGISPALPAITSGFGSGFWVVVARQGGSGGLTGGLMMVGFSPGGRTLLKLSESPERENNKNLDS